MIDEDARIRFLFSNWESLIRISNHGSRTDINKGAEEICLRLLNRLYSKKLEDLNIPGSCNGIGMRDFPSVDLGSLKNEAYQITSRIDAPKFYKDLANFNERKFKRKKLIAHFPKGIRFLILGSLKPKLSKVIIRKYKFFNPEKHIINFSDLITDIGKLRVQDDKRYSEIREMIADQFMPTLFDIYKPNNSYQINPKTVNFISDIIFKTKLLNRFVSGLQTNIGLSSTDIFNFQKIDEALEKINPDNPSSGYNSWHIYLGALKWKMLPIIERILAYDNSLIGSHFLELISIENQLLSQSIFDGHKKYDVSQLTYASICFQEILIHNRILQKINSDMEEKYNAELLNNSKAYRNKYYEDTSKLL